ncbi:MAG: phosphotransferase [Ramlibacter sp.]|nr:phosphotransferase [Ramlibacter sp.]
MHSAAERLTSLRLALRQAQSPWADAPLVPLRDKGLAHDHVRLEGTGVLARIPKQSQLGLGAQANLAYQRACFERAAAGGHTPLLHAVLPPSPVLARGALLVQDIAGRAAALPEDLGAMARTLASLHALPLPMPGDRAPLLDAPDPLQALSDEIVAQAAHLRAAAVAPSVEQGIARELGRLHSWCSAAERPERRLIAFDGHPGNFIVDGAGRAVLVDLEKCRYSYPALDLAHATLYTSTTWDLDTCAELSPEQVLAFYGDWSRAVGAQAASARRWLVPLRRAMWLWSVTWCAKWRALSPQAAQAGAEGEDWSAEHSDAALVRHVRSRVDLYLSAPVLERVLGEFDALDRALAA